MDNNDDETLDTATLSAIFTATRKSLENESWIDEITAPDEDGEPNDYARRVVSLDVVLDALSNIEAAAKREREKTVAQDATVSGNAAALREALVRVRDWLKRMNAGALHALAVAQITPAGAVNRSASGLIEDNDFYISVCDAALAAPARNCDKHKTADEAWDAWMHGPGCKREGQCFIGLLDWLYATEGGAK